MSNDQEYEGITREEVFPVALDAYPGNPKLSKVKRRNKVCSLLALLVSLVASFAVRASAQDLLSHLEGAQSGDAFNSRSSMMN